MTAPLHQAPDADERAGIVAALALTLRQVARTQLGLAEGDYWPADVAEAQAEAVAGLIDDAVAERLAGVEALAGPCAHSYGNPEVACGACIFCRFRAALSGGGEQ